MLVKLIESVFNENVFVKSAKPYCVTESTMPIILFVLSDAKLLNTNELGNV